MEINIKTKFNKGDKIFFMANNRIQGDIVDAIIYSGRMFNGIEEAPKITYCSDGEQLKEIDCFASKEQLCAALMQNDNLPF